MPVSPGLLQAVTPTSIGDFAAQDQRQQMQHRLQAQQLQAGQLQQQSAQEEMATKRRAMAVSLLNGIAAEQDPARQAALYATLRPMAEQYDPTLRLPEAFDPSLSRALTASQVSPEDLMAMTQPQPMTPYQEARVAADAERNAIQREKMSAATTGKALPVAAIKDLEKKAVGYEDMTRLATGFRDPFSGNTLTGGAENVLGRVGGERLGLTDEGQTQWWQDYQGYVNQVRNDLFGAALTATEKAEFQKAVVSPNMDPAQARANLTRQQAIVQKALARAGSVYRKGGYNADQITEYVPEGLTQPDTTSPALDGGRPLVRTQQEYDALPSGAVYREDDGHLYVKP